MSTFRFRLDPVLRRRRLEERAKQRAVAELERERLRVEAEIRGCRDGIEQEKAGLRSALAGERAAGEAGVGAHVADILGARQQAHRSLTLMAQAQAAAVRLAGVMERLDRARLELIEAGVARRSIESWRERREAEWRAGGARREARAMDDLAVTRHGRGGADGTSGDAA